MSHEFEVIETTLGHVIELEERAFVWQMPARFKRDYRSIAEFVTARGAGFSGMPYARYVEVDWAARLQHGGLFASISVLFKKWHYFAGMPVNRPLQGEGRLRANNYPGRRYASAIHCGPYRDCALTYKALMQWLVEQGHVPAAEAFELYRNDPHEVSQQELETQILIPLLS